LRWAWDFLVFLFPILVVVALGFLWPQPNRSWGWSLFGHGLSLLVAVGLGWLAMMVEGFGCAVGDPPYEKGCPDVDFRFVWVKASLYVLGALYVVRGVLWLAVKMFRGSKG
jgi:hypothetical protein